LDSAISDPAVGGQLNRHSTTNPRAGIWYFGGKPLIVLPSGELLHFSRQPNPKYQTPITQTSSVISVYSGLAER
jgi:hypothetical protein